MRSLTLLFLATTLTFLVSCGGGHSHDTHGAVEGAANAVTDVVTHAKETMTKPELIKLEETPGAFDTKALTLEAGKAYNFEVTNSWFKKHVKQRRN